MIATSRFKLRATSYVLLPFLLGAVPLVAQNCTYYVSTSGTDFSSYDPANPGRGKSISTAFRTLQAVHDFVATNASASGLGKQPIEVCAESGDYYASDYVSKNSAPFTTGSADVLDISLSGGGPNTVVTFTPDQDAYVTIHQTGWNGINFVPSAKSVPSYVTVQGFNVQGQAYLINSNSTLNSFALSRTSSPTPQAFYDGNCIAVSGVYQGTTDATHPYAGIPSHITISNNVISACGGGGIGAIESDYLTVDGNSVMNCSWYSIYGTSGISLLDSVGVDGVTGEKNFVTNNWVTGNFEEVPWVATGTITDGEGIIIDTNLNSSGTQKPEFPNGVTIPAYGGRTLVANNVIWGNGSSAIEVFESEHVDVEGNSTYGDVLYQWQPGAFQGRGEISVSASSDVSVANNVFESVAPPSGYQITSYPVSGAVLPGGWAWFENNVYYGGAGYTAAAFEFGAGAARTSPSGIAGFYQGVGEQLNLNPGYVSTTTTGWPERVDLRVTNSTAKANGCVNAGSICDAPVLDILGYPRTTPNYASGAYASTTQ